MNSKQARGVVKWDWGEVGKRQPGRVRGPEVPAYWYPLILATGINALQAKHAHALHTLRMDGPQGSRTSKGADSLPSPPLLLHFGGS